MKSRYRTENHNERMRLVVSVLSVIVLLSTGCATVVFDGESVDAANRQKIRVLLPPFFNATNDDHAGRALTELTGTALVEREIPLYQTEEILISAQGEAAPGPDGRYQELAATVGATHLVIGTVHEYRYKTDLDGDPAVGVTMRLVDARDGRTVWQGSSSNVGYAFASLSSASQRAVRRLVHRMPIAASELEEVEESSKDSELSDSDPLETEVSASDGEALRAESASSDSLSSEPKEVSP